MSPQVYIKIEYFFAKIFTDSTKAPILVSLDILKKRVQTKYNYCNG